MNKIKTISAVLASTVLMAVLTGCPHHHHDHYPPPPPPGDHHDGPPPPPPGDRP